MDRYFEILDFDSLIFIVIFFGMVQMFCALSFTGNMILRVPIIYGQVEYIEESALTILMKNLMNSPSCVMSDYERRFPTNANDIASVLLQLTTRRFKVISIRCTIDSRS